MNKSELEKILNEVENEVAELLKSQTKNLRKAVGEDEGGEASAGGEGAAPAGDEGSAGAPGPAEGSAPGGEDAGMEGSPAPEGAAPEGAAGGEGGGSVEELEAEYAKLPPEELKAHYLACKAAIFKLMGDAEGGAGAAGAPPAGPGADAGAPAGGPAGAPPPPAMKAEAPMAQPKSSVPGTGAIKANGQNDMGKSEITDLKAQVEMLSKALTVLAGQPIRKAVTGVSYVAKSEPTIETKPLSKSEITEKLTAKTSDPKLSKSDRDLINGYYGGAVGLDKLAHLLK